MLARVAFLLITLAPSTVAAAPDPAVPNAPDSTVTAERRRAVEDLVAAMERAACQADEQGYMLCIDPSSSVFHTEQRHWVQDLARHAPEQFAITVSKIGSVTLPEGAAPPPGDDAIAAHVTVRWTMPGARERTFAHDAWFSRREGQWLYAGEAWPTIVIAPDPAAGQFGVTVRYAEGSEDLAREVARVMPGIRARVDRVFAAPLRTPQEVKIYAKMSHLQASIYPSYVNPLGGWNEPGESIKILGSSAARGRALAHVLAHEYGHAVSFECGPKINDAPWWVLEGIAEVAGGAMNAVGSPGARDNRVLDLAITGNLKPWLDLSDFRTVPSNLHGQVYTQGRSMMDFIGRAYGHDARLQLLSELGQGQTLDRACTTALAEPFEAVHARWLHWVMQRAMNQLAGRAEGARPGKRDSSFDPLGLAPPDEP